MTDATWAARTEQAVLDHAIGLVGETGWTRRLAVRAAAREGMSEAEAELLFPHGPQDLAALLSRRHDAAAMAVLEALDAKALKIRERIARGVETRIAAALADEAALRRLSGFFALPQNMALGARLNWETSDQIWRWAGDTATDENHYSKRAILSTLYASVLAVRLASGEAAAAETLSRGIEAVMSYEKFKAKFKGKTWGADLASKLGKMRYGAKPDPVTPV